MKITDKHGQQWQLVPIDPTESIERAYYWQQEKSGFRNCYPVYQAMLSAAPEPELEGVEPVAITTMTGAKMLKAVWYDTPLVPQSAALKALAEKDAEITASRRELSKYQAAGTNLNARKAEIAVLKEQAQRQAEEIAKITKERDDLEFAWAGCSQQLKDACEDLEEVEAYHKRRMVQKDAVLAAQVSQTEAQQEAYRAVIQHQAALIERCKKAFTWLKTKAADGGYFLTEREASVIEDVVNLLEKEQKP